MPTRECVTQQLAQLSGVYGTPRDTRDPESLVRVWQSVLGPLADHVFCAAVGAYLKSDARYWPKPGQILRLARDYAREGDEPTTPAGRYHRWRNSCDYGDGVPCPICGSVLAVVGEHGRLGMQHDVHEHLRRGIPCEGVV